MKIRFYKNVKLVGPNRFSCKKHNQTLFYAYMKSSDEIIMICHTCEDEAIDEGIFKLGQQPPTPTNGNKAEE